jgi:DNA-binding transcriptional regulator YiaG
MSNRTGSMSFAEQMRRSMRDLESIMRRGESPTGNGRFTVRQIDVEEPSVHTARTVRRTRDAMRVSQAVFADVLGVSAALVRAWELGTRVPSPLARRLLDEVRANPTRFARLVRPSVKPPRNRRVA